MLQDNAAQSGKFTGFVDYFGLSICFANYFLLNNIFHLLGNGQNNSTAVSFSNRFNLPHAPFKHPATFLHSLTTADYPADCRGRPRHSLCSRQKNARCLPVAMCWRWGTALPKAPAWHIKKPGPACWQTKPGKWWTTAA